MPLCRRRHSWLSTGSATALLRHSADTFHAIPCYATPDTLHHRNYWLHSLSHCLNALTLLTSPTLPTPSADPTDAWLGCRSFRLSTVSPISPKIVSIALMLRNYCQWMKKSKSDSISFQWIGWHLIALQRSTTGLWILNQNYLFLCPMR